MYYDYLLCFEARQGWPLVHIFPEIPADNKDESQSQSESQSQFHSSAPVAPLLSVDRNGFVYCKIYPLFDVVDQPNSESQDSEMKIPANESSNSASSNAEPELPRSWPCARPDCSLVF